MDIILSGYGRMGREIEKIALSRGHTILARIDSPGDWEAHDSLISRCDIIIDFSLPDAAAGNIMHCFDRNKPVVTGTTGWYDNLEQIRERCTREGQTLFVSSNFSLGVNILLDLVAKAALLTDKAGGYRASIHETHHIHKLDSPSGTAIRLAGVIIGNSRSIRKWTANAGPGEDEVPVTSNREGEVTGIHSVRFESGADIIELRHEAKSREGFAEGALKAAEWVLGRKGFFEMKDLLSSMD